MDGLKRYVNDDRFRLDGDKNMRLLAFVFTIVFVWTGPKVGDHEQNCLISPLVTKSRFHVNSSKHCLLY